MAKDFTHINNSYWPYYTLAFSCTVCHLLRGGVAAIFGPQSAHTASHVQSICDTMEIPHLETRWDYRLRRQSCLVNLYPHPTTLSKVRTNFRSNSLIKAALRRKSAFAVFPSCGFLTLRLLRFTSPHRRTNIAFLDVILMLIASIGIIRTFCTHNSVFSVTL